MVRNKTNLIKSLALAAAAFTSMPMNTATAAEPGKRILKRSTKLRTEDTTKAPATPKGRIIQPGVRAMKKRPITETPAGEKRIQQPGIRMRKNPGKRMLQNPGVRMRQSPGIRMIPEQQKK